MITFSILRQILLIFAFSMFIIDAFGQKLPNKQITSIHAPKEVKIDGRINEWVSGFGSYNKATNFYCLLANNDEKIYLTIKITDPLIQKKVLRGGIIFTVSGKNTQPLSVTFPIIGEANASAIGGLINKYSATRKKNQTKSSLDSLLLSMNKQLLGSSKEIEIKGTHLITDSPISIYNTDGIKAGNAFDAAGALIFEFAIDLRHLNLGSDFAGKLNYSILSNGIFARTKVVMLDGNAPPATMVVIGSNIAGKSVIENQILNTDTRIDGTYLIVK